jgi:hypothetical protein
MTGDRVEALERRVRELEATVDGLTEELIDTKDRLEPLERTALDTENTTRRHGRSPSANAEADRSNEATDRSDNTTTDDGDGIDQSAGDPSETDSTDETDDRRSERDDEASGIIIA